VNTTVSLLINCSTKLVAKVAKDFANPNEDVVKRAEVISCSQKDTRPSEGLMG